MLDAKKWHVVTESQFPWEEEGLNTLRRVCQPDTVLEAWTNFEFFDENGRIYEVDALLLTVHSLLIVELKHYTGQIAIDEMSWIRRRDPHALATTEPNPLRMTNAKTRILSGLLRSRAGRQQDQLARVWPLVFVTHPNSEIRYVMAGRPQPVANLQSIESMVNQPPLQAGRQRLDAAQLRVTRQALESLSLGASRKREFRVGSYVLQSLLGDGPNYQDHLARNVNFQTVQARVRTFSASDENGRTRSRRAAQREYMLVSELRHDRILSPIDLQEYELGPALIYPYYDKAQRLDHLVANSERWNRFDFLERLALWAQIGEALRYAHQRRVYHRSLSPQNVLVLLPDNEPAEVKVMNWQTASAEERTQGTVHLSELVEEETTAYMAPEILTSTLDADHSADLFSLGCIGYTLFGGKPPAYNQSELQDRLRNSQGLDLNGVVDRLPEPLIELVRNLTHPVHFRRPESAEVFLRRVAEIEAGHRHGFAQREKVVDPFSAHPGEVILPGLVLEHRLGQGSTAVAFLVQRADSEERLVLKLALKPERDALLQEESEVLSQLKHRTLVELREVVRWQGAEGERLGLLLSSAGDKTLAQRLSQDGVIGLELLQRWGNDLLEAVEVLEKAGLPHRDIKPANLGVKLLHNKELHLVLFDFSLSRTDPRKVTVGTTGYLDPFLHSSRRPWDVSAERFAAAATLFEMATGRVPQWGEDGRINPAVVAAELYILPGDFEPALRESCMAFFRRALAPQQRFESASQMREAWNQIFQMAEILRVTPPVPDLPEVVPSETPLAQLTTHPTLLQLFERLKVTTAGQLLGYRKAALNRLSNAGAQTRAQLLEFYERLQERVRGEILPRVVNPESTLESLLSELLPRQPKDQLLVKTYLGDWLSGRDAARRAKVDERLYSGILLRSRQSWMRNHTLDELRGQMFEALKELGGAATVEEMSEALLRIRGSQSAEARERTFQAKSVLRAALEAEDGMDAPRFQLFQPGGESIRRRRLLVGTDFAVAQGLFALGKWADEMVAQNPLPSETRQQSVLASQAPAGDWPEGRLPRLATALAEKARLSSRGQLYPAGMEAKQALQLCASLLGGRTLRMAEVRELVSARYPEAAPLPTNPEVIQKLFGQVNLALTYDPESGTFRPPTSTTAPSSHTSTLTGGDMPVPRSQLESRLDEALRRGSPQVLKVRARDQAEAEGWLKQRYGLAARSLEGLLLDQLSGLCKENEIPWEETVLVADRQGQQGPDWGNLRGLAEQAAEQVIERLSQEREVLVLKRFSLWARFGLLHRVGQLLEHSGRREGPAAIVLLAPHSEGLPTVDGHALPLPPASRPLEWSRSLVGSSAEKGRLSL